MKRHPALVALSREHHTALSLANRVRKAAATGDAELLEAARAEVVARFETELEPHFAAEELSLLPELASAGEIVLVERTLDEHRELRALVHALASREAAPEPAQCLGDFGALLAAHVRFEERELFERAQLLDPDHAGMPESPAVPS